MPPASPSRRAIFGTLPAVAMLAPPTASLADTAPLAAKWRRAEALARNLADDDTAGWERLDQLHVEILRGPVTCEADALAKLRCVLISGGFECHRYDGADKGAAADLEAWLSRRAA